MDFDALIEKMTPELYQRLKLAVEIGKWPNGEVLTAQQRESCLQAVISWDFRHKPEEERVAYIDTRKHPHCGSAGDELDLDLNLKSSAEAKPLKWQH